MRKVQTLELGLCQQEQKLLDGKPLYLQTEDHNGDIRPIT